MTSRVLVVLGLAACGSSPAAPDAAAPSIDARVDAPGPGISVSPTQRDFGGSPLGAPSPYTTFEISTGSHTGRLIVAFTGTDAGQFTMIGGNCDGAVLAPPGACALWVAFAPTSVGTKTATLTIIGSPGGTTTAGLLGTGIGPPPPSLTPSASHFGTTVTGQSTPTQRLTLTNRGVITTSPFTVTKAGSDPAQFQVLTDTCTGQQLGPSATCFVDVRFHPTSLGPKSSSMVLSATTGGSANASLDGTCIAPPPAIAITSTSSDFGGVGYGVTSAPITFTATNTGGSPTAGLTTSIVQTGSQFAIVAGTNTCSGMTLAALATCTLQVTFTGTQLGSATATLRIEDGAVAGTSSLAATVVLIDDINIPSPSIADFSDVLIGATSAPIELRLSNIGGTTHGPIAITLGGAASGSFAVVNDTCTGTFLAPAASCSLGVTFSPSASGLTTAFVQFVSFPGGTSTVALRGNGLAPVSSARAAELEHGQLSDQGVRGAVKFK